MTPHENSINFVECQFLIPSPHQILIPACRWTIMSLLHMHNNVQHLTDLMAKNDIAKNDIAKNDIAQLLCPNHIKLDPPSWG